MKNQLLQIILSRVISKIAPPPKLTVSQWADQYRRLSPESSAESGKWRTSRAPYQQGMMDALNESEVKEVIYYESIITTKIQGKNVKQKGGSRILRDKKKVL